MKIIAAISGSTFLVEASDDELARIAGFSYASSLEHHMKPSVGKVVNVSPLWAALTVSRERVAELQKMATALRTVATRVESINAALAQPIIEVQTKQS